MAEIGNDAECCQLVRQIGRILVHAMGEHSDADPTLLEGADEAPLDSGRNRARPWVVRPLLVVAHAAGAGEEAAGGLLLHGSGALRRQVPEVAGSVDEGLATDPVGCEAVDDRSGVVGCAGDSELAEAIKVLARAHQSMIWTRQRQTNQLRSTLREFYPAALDAFDELAGGDALAILAIAPTPTAGRLLSLSKIQAAPRRGGRQRRIEPRAIEIQTALRAEHLAAPDLIADAMGATVGALVAVISELNTQITGLETKLADRFEQHPDAKIIRSLPGLGMTLGARVLAEFGDAPNRYTDAKSRKNYSGMSPITRASGKHHVVLARYARNKRLSDARYLWAFATLTASPGTRAFYDEHRSRGETNNQALRALANRLVGILHGCLRHQTLYDEHTAWAHRHQQAA